MRRTAIAALLPLLVIGLEPVPAAALTLNVAFVGTVTELYPVLEPGIEPGGDSYGSFQIDTAAVDSNPQAHRGRYPDPSDIQSLTVTLPEPSGGMLSLCGAGLLLLTRRARRRRTRGNARSRPS